MLHDYNYPADEPVVRRYAEESKWAEAFDALALPLHEALYKSQSFDLMEEMSATEAIILGLDYVQMQVGQGGFIQLIQNGYVPLLVNVIESAQQLGISPRIQKTLDDALKVFVLNKDPLMRETTPEEFARLYEEFGEFDPLDKEFMQELPLVMQTVVTRTISK